MAATVALMIGLAVLLPQSTGQQPGFADLSTQNAGQQTGITDKHNDLRRSVNPSATNMLRMEWEPKAADTAGSWAQQCTFSHSPSSKRTVNGKACGENLYMTTGLTLWRDVVQSWYDEVKDFEYGHGSVGGAVTGHFTQIVWYRSNRIGCSVAYCPGKKYTYYYVCHYCPAGNIVGSINTPYKSGRPCADCPNACDNKLCTNPCKYDNIYSNCPDMSRDPGCNHPDVKNWCKASCQCKSEII